jgi:hypothetical protein
MRRLSWWILVLLLVGSAEAIGGSCPPDDGPSLAYMEKRYAQASTVFIGHLVRVEETGAMSTGELLPSRPSVQATFHAVEVLKGHPPGDGRIRAPAPAACFGPLLLVGFDHVVFLNEDNLIRSWGQAIFLYRHPGHVGDGGSQRLLEQLRELRKKDSK